jgi:hypothetical protein
MAKRYKERSTTPFTSLQDLKALKKIGFGRDSCARKPSFFVLVLLLEKPESPDEYEKAVLSPKKHPKN